MDILGQPEDLKQDAQKGAYEEVVRPVLGDNKYRFLYGPLKVKTVFYPSIYTDPNTNEVKSIRKGVNVPDSGSIFDQLAALDKTIRASMGEEKPRSPFVPSTKFLYLGFNRAEPQVKVRIIEVKRTVMEGLIKLEDARSTRDSSKLRYGPIFSWDAIVTKSQDPNKPKEIGTKYSVQVDPESMPLSGQIPVEWLKLSPADFFGKVDKLKVFTEEELDIIHATDLDLREHGKSKSNEEIVADFQKFPIDFTAVNSDGSYVFPNPNEFMVKLKEMGIKFIENNQPAQLPEYPNYATFTPPANTVSISSAEEVLSELQNVNAVQIDTPPIKASEPKKAPKW